MLHNKKILFVLMSEGFQDTEFLEPYTMLKDAGSSVVIGGFKPGVSIGKYGHKQPIEVVLDQLTEEELCTYDALVIPGGPGSTKYLWDSALVQSLVKFFYEHKKIVATICYACIVPVQTGLLKGKIATVYPSEEAKKILIDHGVIFSSDGCVTDFREKMITAQGPTYATAFGQAILNLLDL